MSKLLSFRVDKYYAQNYQENYVMIEFEADVLNIIQRTRNVKSFRFKIKKDVDFKPGQFFSVTIKIGKAEEVKYFSFSSSPTEKGYVEFTKRITDSEYSNAMDKLKIGDRAKLKMPYGSFTFTGEYEKIAFLSGGIGITPIRSMCKSAIDKGLLADIVLIYGSNKEEDIVFRQDFDKMALVNKNMRVVYVLTSPGIKRDKWPGRTGLIDDRVIREEVADYKERVFYICGPPKMVKGLVDILINKLGVDKNKIKIERFAGY